MSESLACLLVAVRPGRRPRLRPPARAWSGRRPRCARRPGRARPAARSPCSPPASPCLAWWRSAGHPRRALMPVLVLVADGGDGRAVDGCTTSAASSSPVLLTTNDGTTLLGANCDWTYYDDIGGWDIRCLGVGLESATASTRSVRRRRAPGAGRRLRPRPPRPRAGRGRRPRRAAARRLRPRVARRPRRRRGEGPVARCGPASSAGGCWRRSPSSAGSSPGGCGAGPAAPRSRWWLAVPVGRGAAHDASLFYGAHRIRAPAEPAVVVLAALGRSPPSAVRSPRRRPSPPSPTTSTAA